MRVKDRVCGKQFYLDEAATQQDHEGWVYFFCSAKCHRLFVEAPGRYANKPAGFSPEPTAETTKMTGT
jgi:YHS domain-containing protein